MTVVDYRIPTRAGKLRVLVGGKRRNEDFDLVLVHGLIVSSSFMEPTAKLLMERHRVLVPDLLGHGESETPDHPLSIKEHALALAKALKHLDVKRPIIVGGSYGCHVAVELSNLLDVKGLVFIGPTPGGELPGEALELATDALREPPSLVLKVIKEAFRIGFGRLIQLVKDMAKYPFIKRLRKSKAPTLVITGEHDPFFDADFMNETASVLHSSRALCMPDAAHGLPYSEPEAISNFIEQFIKQIEDETQLGTIAA